MENLAIIGGGNLGKSIISGLLTSGLFGTTQITVSGKSKNNLTAIKQTFNVVVSQSNTEAIQNAKWILLCVQPKQLASVLDEIKETIQSDQMLISTVTGVGIQEINKVLPNNKVIRVMPNTGASKKMSMTCIAANNECAEELKTVEKNVFNYW